LAGKRGERYQSAPWLIVSVQAAPRDAKSAERMEGAIMACGGIAGKWSSVCKEISVPSDHHNWLQWH